MTCLKLTLGRTSRVSLALILVLGLRAEARRQYAETGKVIDISTRYIDSPAPQNSILLPRPQVVVGYSLQIRVGDLTYVVDAPFCCPLKSRFKPEWVAGDILDFRFERDSIYLRRHRGKELKAKLVKVKPYRSDGPTHPVGDDLAGTRFLSTPSKRAKTMPLGLDFLRFGDRCLTLTGDVIADDFFHGLEGHKTSSGMVFRKGTQTVETYPQKMTVRIIAALGICSPADRSPEGSSPKEPSLEEEIMRSVTFSAAWKHSFDERVADIGPAVESRISNPTPLPSSLDWWEYEFLIRSEGVQLSDALVILLQSPDGKLLARLSGRVGPAR